MKFPPHTVRSSITTPLGRMTLAASTHALVGAWFDGQQHQPDWSAWPTMDTHPVLQATAEQLGEYFAGLRQRFDLPLDLSGGTTFQQAVWAQLLRIPHGTTVSYGTISHQLGKPTAMRAVGAAVGRNPISIINPCHRVLGAQGSLTGYAGGLERKIALLEHETQHPPTA
ncbi:methylated-DNA--[protein]-cysteine S-methyltransferase [Curvibacter sp. CHRR-16]|uniref:methylated-DNA--[protein]-cysteine S-methyltransferase n=1 Tax=Curvibacter sp. CHRR-16 TaxID=2835872 RepID=UPI001BDA9BAC|nr:methylated-DNA--[protein]-cysteine S-methyltransferase [Curvibacter sp. CHRR-16]MBT0569799.1 methylated-DNA--[protein]-cysteine S-methyltransferase [Curvibacter sp. CHRR-16]